MLRLPPINLQSPSTVQDAAKAIAKGNARLVAGGTDLWPNMKRRHQKAETVISLMSIPRARRDRLIRQRYSHRRNRHACQYHSRRQDPRTLARFRKGSRIDIFSANQEHGHHRWQSLHRHSLHLLQPDRGMAPVDRLLSQGRRHDLLGCNKVAAVLGAHRK